ncbi:unnamed protein product [Calypogeia fissa]
MAAETLTVDLSVKVPLPQLWEAFKDLHHLMPRLLPGFIESSRIVDGPVGGGVGSVRDCKFTCEVPGISWTKELIDKVDDEKHIVSYKVVEGEVLAKCSSFRVTWRFDPPPLPSSSTDVNWTAEIVPLPTAETANNGRGDKDNDRAARETAEEDARRRNDLYRDSAQLLMKQLEAHLMVTKEYSQPSPKERMRDDLLLN